MLSNHKIPFVKGPLSPVSSSVRLAASMTLEAALVLPICLFFLVNLGSSIEMIRLHNRLQLAVVDTGRKTALYACENSGDVLASLVTAGYVRSQILRSCGREYLDTSPLVGGAGGLQLWESNLLLGKDELDIAVTYTAAPVFSTAGFLRFRMTNRYVVHLWSGYEIPEKPTENGVVYLTENAAVYHTDRNCTHISLRINCIDSSTLQVRRNAYGEKYTKCGICAAGDLPELVYIAEEGDHYHYERTCSGLKRTVTTVPFEKAAGMKLCERCGKE